MKTKKFALHAVLLLAGVVLTGCGDPKQTDLELSIACHEAGGIPEFIHNEKISGHTIFCGFPEPAATPTK